LTRLHGLWFSVKEACQKNHFLNKTNKEKKREQMLSVTFSKENFALHFILNGAELFFKSVGLVAFFVTRACSFILDLWPAGI